MFHHVMGEKYYCGLDIGTQRIKAGILKVRDQADMELIGVYDHKTSGFKDHAVTDLAEFSECVHHAVSELTGRAGVKIKQVQLGLGAGMAQTRRSQASVPLVDRGNKVITHNDLKKINHHVRLLGIKMEEEILYDLPQGYRVDDTDSALNPLGLFGRVLGVESLLILINGNRIRNILKAIQQAGYDVANSFVSSYASSDVVLTDEEKKKGCVLIDVGAQCAAILIFWGGILRSVECIDAGGANRLTRAIADKLNLPFELAEEIKESYATVSDSDRHSDEEILVKSEEVYRPIKRGLIYEAIHPGIEEFAGRIREVVSSPDLKDRGKVSISMIGGGALLPGLIEHISETVNMPVRLAQMSLPLRKNLSQTAIFSSVVGLAQNGFKKTFRYSFAANGQKEWGKGLANRMRDLYQEYF